MQESLYQVITADAYAIRAQAAVWGRNMTNQILTKKNKELNEMTNIKTVGVKASQKRLDAVEKIKKLRDGNKIAMSEDLGEVSPGHKLRIVEYSQFTRGEHDKSCQECGEEFPVDYMVTDEVFSNAGFEDGIVCLSCLAKRLGRKLKREDFQDIRNNRKLFAGMLIAEGKL